MFYKFLVGVLGGGILLLFTQLLTPSEPLTLLASDSASASWLATVPLGAWEGSFLVEFQLLDSSRNEKKKTAKDRISEA